MTKITSIGIENLRRLKSVKPNVRLAPITVLLGKNSVGKSTFARVFPLLRQSAERRKRSPVLWFGDLVDFGSIGRAVSEGETDISFMFDVEFPAADADVDPWDDESSSYWSRASRAKIEKASVKLTLAENPDSKTGFAKALHVSVFGGTIEINFPLTVKEGNYIKVNGEVQNLPSKDHLLMSFQGDFLPKLIFYTRQQDGSNSDAYQWVPANNPWIDNAAQVIRRFVHGNTSTATARRLAKQVPVGTVEQIAAALPKIPGPHSWKSYMASATSRIFMARQLHKAQLAGHVTSILQQLDAGLSTYFAGVRYLKPLRATAERYYRRVDLSVSEIDPEGRNLPMFLDSLTGYQLNDFRAWIKKNLDIDAYPNREGDQLMVMAQGANDAQAYNVADMGFGISQVLPIAAQLWAINRRVGHTKPASVVVLEQPELHLHPDYQARLADVFAGAVSNLAGQTAVPIIVETHSQQIVNRLGQLIEAGELASHNVSVLLFESSENNASSTSIRISEFDERGILKNWPFGFFEPEVR